MVGEIISEWRARSNRNGGRDHSGMVGDIERNQQASAPGFTKRIRRNPLMVCFVDELGDELAKVREAGGGGVWVTAITGLLKKCYNAWATINTAEKVGEESERIDWPAVSIIGAATPEMFFNSLQPRDLESGFANRLLILPFEGYGRPREQSPRSELKHPPKELVAGLRALPKQSNIAEQTSTLPPMARPGRSLSGWSGPRAQRKSISRSVARSIGSKMAIGNVMS
jgi:hypothetical protein